MTHASIGKSGNLPEVRKQAQRESQEQQREHDAQALDRQPMREPRPQRRGKHAGDDHQGERRQVHIADAPGRQSLGAQTSLGAIGDQKISDVATWGQLPAGAVVTKTPVLFPRLEIKE